MNMLASLQSDNSIANETDNLGGSRALETDLYKMIIKTAYLSKASSEALGLVLSLETENKEEVRQTLWMTSGKEKGCKNYYVDKKGEKHYLPGFLHANSLCLLTVGKEISQMETETKVINVWSSEAKAEVPTKVEMIMELLNQEIAVGLIKQVVDKTAKDAGGVYQPTGETREENEIDKLFRARDLMTTAEIRAQATEASFATAWKEKWAGKTKDRSNKTKGTAGVPTGAAPGVAGGTKKPANSLFGA